uniref:Uncharacterized protein n=1 Tax=Anguilla anguilla TaxID=7936 RepID=A0A0E9QFZ0_ANGAN
MPVQLKTDGLIEVVGKMRIGNPAENSNLTQLKPVKLV